MYISRLLLNGRYLKNGVACSVGRRIVAFETHSYCGSADSKKTSTNHTGGSGLILKKALIVRVYLDKKGNLQLSEEGHKLDKKTHGKLRRYIELLDRDFKVGEAFVVTDVDIYEAVALTCCGHKDAGVNELECLDEHKENLRCGMAAGFKALKLLVSKIKEESEHINDEDARPIQEGYQLTRWRPEKEFIPIPVREVSGGSGNDTGFAYTNDGVQTANAQNWARYLSQMPANKMTPEAVVQEAKKQLSKLGVKVTSHDKKYIESKKMEAFLAVAQGSSAPPKLLECEYRSTIDGPNVLIVAKGVTFDSGGLCLKNPTKMLAQGGMTGAAVALGTIWGLAALKAKVNVKLVVPLCENMISGQCLKVGDVVPTLQGLNVKIEDTDLEGHLMLADALAYGQAQYKPKYVVDVASLTPGMEMATGGNCYGCFTPNEDLWTIARNAGVQSGDRPWRFPIWECYSKQIMGDTKLYNLKNRGSGIASHCNGAAFIQKFVSCDNWLHYDITGVGKMSPDTAPIYLDPNLMTGRPTRALIRAVTALGSNEDNGDECTGVPNTGTSRKL